MVFLLAVVLLLASASADGLPAVDGASAGGVPAATVAAAVLHSRLNSRTRACPYTFGVVISLLLSLLLPLFASCCLLPAACRLPPQCRT
jgi:hypothetical protein